MIGYYQAYLPPKSRNSTLSHLMALRLIRPCSGQQEDEVRLVYEYEMRNVVYQEASHPFIRFSRFLEPRYHFDIKIKLLAHEPFLDLRTVATYLLGLF